MGDELISYLLFHKMFLSGQHFSELDQGGGRGREERKTGEQDCSNKLKTLMAVCQEICRKYRDKMIKIGPLITQPRTVIPNHAAETSST